MDMTHDYDILFTADDTVSPDNGYKIEVANAGAELVIDAGLGAEIKRLQFVALNFKQVENLRDTLDVWLESKRDLNP